MPVPGEAISTAPANYVPFAGDQFAGMKVVHVGSDFHDLAHEFVADRERDLNG
jgi:hypothetical protein